jgi:hypothetical protein
MRESTSLAGLAIRFLDYAYENTAAGKWGGTMIRSCHKDNHAR